MKGTTASILMAFVLIGGVFIFAKGNPKEKENENTVLSALSNNVTMENKFQIIEIKAKGGYIPRKSVARAGIPTILRFNTDGTFDCSSAVRIPNFNINQNLPISGLIDIELPASNTGLLRGSCSMGMYSFEIVFQN